MSKQEAIIKGLGSKQMGRITVLDAGYVEDESAEGQEFMAAMQGETRGLREEEVVRGVVVEIRGKDVIIDIGYKGSGTVNLDEFNNPDGTQGVQVGEVVEVLLEMLEDANGNVRLSRERAEKMKIWDEVEKAFRSNMTVHGTVLEKVKGGLAVDIGIRAFLPGSQVDMKPVRNLDPFLGKSFDMKVIKVNRRRGNIVLSRKLFLETINASLKEETLAGLEEGKLVEGAIKNITEYGAFVDLGGVDGLLHITDMSWGRISHPSEMVQIGMELEIKVLDIDWERERISLGLKQLQSYPWKDVAAKYPVGTRVNGKVVSITNYGAFIELEPGIEGLVHISEMSWTRNVRHPSKIVSIGEAIEAVVLKVDETEEKISLGMKQTEQDPWVILPLKYPVGTRINGKVRNLTSFGAFVEIEPGIDGLIHISDMSWTKRVQHPSEVVKKGDAVDVVILNIDSENKRISLGLKQAEEDPWLRIGETYPVGTELPGKVVRLMDKGVVVDLGNDIEGFVPVSQLNPEGTVTNPADFAWETMNLVMRVLEVDPIHRRIVLAVTSVPAEQPPKPAEPSKVHSSEDEIGL